LFEETPRSFRILDIRIDLRLDPDASITDDESILSEYRTRNIGEIKTVRATAYKDSWLAVAAMVTWLPKTWLLSEGWRRHGLIDFHELPSASQVRSRV